MAATNRLRRSPLSCLVGDDDDAVREAVVEILDAWGFRTVTASSGEDALRILLCEPIDFTILDVEMPSMTGIEVIERYLTGPWIAATSSPPRRALTPRRMPTIFMSGNRSEEVRRAAEALGTTFVGKPIEVRRMRSAVDRLLADHLT